MTIDDFIALIQEETGLQVTMADAERDLDQVADWDSMHLLSLLTVLERTTGHPVSLPDILEAANLREIYLAAVRT